jgi:hypothetical protein
LSYPVGVAVFAPPPVFTADSPATSATVGTAYSYQFKASAPTGEPAATFRLASGTLPSGLSLNQTTGVLSGTPTKAGTFTFRVEAENVATGTVSPSRTITVASG